FRPDTTTLRIAPGWMPNSSRTSFGRTSCPLEESFVIAMAYLIQKILTNHSMNLLTNTGSLPAKALPTAVTPFLLDFVPSFSLQNSCVGAFTVGESSTRAARDRLSNKKQKICFRRCEPLHCEMTR